MTEQNITGSNIVSILIAAAILIILGCVIISAIPPDVRATIEKAILNIY